VKAVEAVAVRSVSAIGTVHPLINASGQDERIVNRTGKVTVMVRVTDTPFGGRPTTQ
jgi:hypothetical protein